MEWLYRIYGWILRRRKGIEKSIPQGKAGGLSVSIEYRKSAHRVKANDLLKKATAYKAEERWDEAISSLRKAYAILGQDIANYPTETALRLPLYLQQAGRYAEAQKEFERLLSSVEERVTFALGDQNKAKIPEFLESEREKILSKMQLAEKREQKRRPKKSDS